MRIRHIAAAWLIALTAFAAIWSNHESARAGMMLKGIGASVSSGSSGCTEATAFLARTSGLSANEISATTTLICGLVTDGIINGNMGSTGCGTILDGFYWFATNSVTTAKLNLCGTAYGATYNGTPAESSQFTADRGYTGDGSTVYQDTGFTPSSAGSSCGNGAATCNMSLNSAAIGVYNNSSEAASGTISIVMGVARSSSFTYLIPRYTGDLFYGEVNGALFQSTSNATTNASFAVSRTNSLTVTLYKNGGSVASSGADTTGILPETGPILIFAYTVNGVLSACCYPGVISAAWWGAGVDSTQAAAIDNRMNQAATILGINNH